jgi:hypothetical protein
MGKPIEMAVARVSRSTMSMRVPGAAFTAAGLAREGLPAGSFAKSASTRAAKASG